MRLSARAYRAHVAVFVALAWVSLAVHAAALTWIDARTHRLPNRWVASCALIGVITLLAAGWSAGDLVPFARGLIVGTAALALFLVIHVLGGMGMGDVKYAWVLGFYLGTLGVDTAWWGLWWGFGLAALAVLVSRIARRARATARIPFGPYMTAGAALACVSFALTSGS